MRPSVAVMVRRSMGLPPSETVISDVARAGQNAVAKGLAELAIRAADKKCIEEIGATGGVFYNEAITDTVKNHIIDNGYEFIQHTNTCAGDGSVSLGQAIIAKKI